MINYEPELMYALDSKSEYSDWKNVYNVSGSDILYCPICLGRVKLWNGQDPDKTYKKQRCFHHIDGMCTQESRIHFAYKTWLLEKGSKFKVTDKVYEVESSEIEKTLHTKFGDYRPDIIVNTADGIKFYIEIADTNKKTEDYILKWDELNVDVLELDVNEQLINATTDSIPEFKTIYSSSTGECFIKHYIRKDYDELITERKIYWKRKDLLNYKIQWERLDWFWGNLQEFYTDRIDLTTLVKSFQKMTSDDQRFVCRRMRGKHISLRDELENYYTDKNDIEKVKLKKIDKVVRSLNNEFDLSHSKGKPYLCRNSNFVEFITDRRVPGHRSIYCEKKSPNDIYEYFHQYVQNYLTNAEEIRKQELERKIKNEKAEERERLTHKVIRKKYDPVLEHFRDLINNSKNKLWNFSYRYYSSSRDYYIYISLLGHHKSFSLDTSLKKEPFLEEIIKTKIYEEMKSLRYDLEYNDNLLSSNSNVRIMEER